MTGQKQAWTHRCIVLEVSAHVLLLDDCIEGAQDEQAQEVLPHLVHRPNCMNSRFRYLLAGWLAG